MSSKVVSCVYDLLDMGTTGQWKDDGTVILNRPPASTKLDKIKFRSFSANIKSSIQNIQAPSLNCSLCANVEVLNTSTTAPSSITTDELSSKPKLLTSGNVADTYSLNILNQTGLKNYNNIYGTNTINISNFNVPLNNSIQDSIQNGMKLAKIELLKTLGLSSSEASNPENFDYMSFQDGSYRYPLQQVQSMMPLNSFIKAYDIDYLTNKTARVIPKLLDHYAEYEFDLSTGNGSASVVNEFDYNIYASWTPNISWDFYLATTDSTTVADLYRFYHLPDAAIQITKGQANWTACDLKKDSIFSKFAAKSKYGLVLSANSGNSLYNIYGAQFVAMASDDVLNKPSFYCATLQRMLYNPEEFICCGFKYYSPKYIVNDYTSHLTEYLNLVQSYGCPTTAFFVKFDTWYILVGDSTIRYFNTLYFMDVRGSNKTFYVYTFTTTTSADDYWNGCIITDKANSLLSRNTFTFTDTTDFDIVGSDYKKWNNMIDTYFGNGGVLALNFGSVRGLIVITQNGAVWCPFDNYLGTDQGLVTCNLYTERFNENGNADTLTMTLSKVIPSASTDNTIISRSFVFRNLDTSAAASPSSFTTLSYDKIRSSLRNYQMTNSNPLQYPNYFLPWCIQREDIDSDTVLFSIVADENRNCYWYPGSVKEPATGIRYTLANSMISVNTWNGTMTPYLPTINEHGTTADYNWISKNHISPDQAQGYQYVYYNCNVDGKQTSYNEFINSIFNWDITNNTITFPVVPLYRTADDGSSTLYAYLVFYMTFTTTPNVISFDPNVKQGLRTSCASYYSTFKQVINKQPSLYINTYQFDDYFVILDENYYNTLNMYLALRNSDQTLKLICNDFPTLNNIVFYLNETAMIDFKEAACSHNEAVIEARIIDYNGNILQPADAPLIYSNIVIAIDWQFY